MKKQFALPAASVVMTVAGIITGGHIYWWDLAAWVFSASCCAWAWRIRHLRRYLSLTEDYLRHAETGDWLCDSASWPHPWTHHDLDFPDGKLPG